jgi:uncharacterized protein YdaU (DUF1376 family)
MATKAKTDIWMPLYISDYLGDTQHLSRDEHGGYILLMMAYWRNRGPLPDDDKRLSSIVKATSKEWRILRQILSDFFIVEEGVWRHKRIDRELTSSLANRKQKSIAGAASAAKRWGTSDNGSLNETITDVITDVITDGLRHCNPSPSPSPLQSKNYSVVNTHNDSLTCATIPAEGVSSSPATSAANACVVMRQHGIQDCNPGHPTLLALVATGTTLPEFEHAAIESSGRGKGFSYALGMLKNQRKESASLPTHSGAHHEKFKSRHEQNIDTLRGLTTNKPIDPSSARLVGASTTRLDE